MHIRTLIRSVATEKQLGYVRKQMIAYQIIKEFRYLKCGVLNHGRKYYKCYFTYIVYLLRHALL